MQNIFFDIGLIIIIATILAYIAKLIKQPLIPAYIIAGLVIGPMLKLVTDMNIITTLSEIGMAFLLFVVGLELNLKRLRDISFMATIGGTAITTVLFFLSYFVSILAGLPEAQALYIALVVIFSSTMVVVKILSDKKELDTLHGRLTIGILLIQDVAAIVVLSILTTSTFSVSLLMFSISRALLLLVIALALSKFIFPTVFKFGAKSQELLFMLALSICFVFAIATKLAGFSFVIGAFLAGISLANLPYNVEIIGKIKPLRDFFAIMFFATLGMEVGIASLNNLIVPTMIIILLTVLLKPFVAMILTSVYGYSKKTSFLTSISLGQVSEFSLIIVALGYTMGHVPQSLLSATIIATLFTLTLTSYLIKFDVEIYRKVSAYLSPFEKLAVKKIESEYYRPAHRKDVILFGFDRIGYSIYHKLVRMNKPVIIVDFNPDVIKRLSHDRVDCMYGDASDPEVLERLCLEKAKMIISTIPDQHDNLAIIKAAKKRNKNLTVFVTANHVDEALELYNIGADYVILPHFLGGDHVSLLVEKFDKNLNKLLKTRTEHIKELNERKRLGHHPLGFSHNRHHQI